MTIDERLRDGLLAAAMGPELDEVDRDLLVVRARGQRLRQRRTATRLAMAAVALVVVGVVATSIRTAGDGETNVTTERRGSWEQLLRPLPRVEGAGGFVVRDFAQLAMNTGVQPPEPSATSEQRDAYWNGVRDDIPRGEFLPLGDLTAQQLRAELGVDPTDIARMATMDATGGGSPGLQRLAVLEGDFDRQAIEAAVNADAVWSPDLEVVTYRDVSYFSWGDGSLDVSRRTPVRSLGLGGRLILLDQHTLAWTSSTLLAEATIDAWQGTQERLASGPRARRMSEALESRNVDWAMVPAAPEGASALAVGLRSGSPAELILVLDEISADAARQAGESLRTSVQEGREAGGALFRDTFSITELTVEGKLVSGRLTYTGRTPLLDAVSTRQVPLFNLEGSRTPPTSGP